MKHLIKYNESDISKSKEYIESYKIFESSDEDANTREESITNDIMDMSLDIQDEGFRVVYEGYDSWRKTMDPNTYYTIMVSKAAGFGIEPFYIDKIEDFLIRVNKYGKTNPCQIEMYVPRTAFGTGEKKGKLFIRDNGDMSVMFSVENYLINNKISYVEIRVRIRWYSEI